MTTTEADIDKCQYWDDLPIEMQNKIEKTALTVLKSLAANQIDDFWDAVHPLLKKATTKQKFFNSMELVKLNLANVEQLQLKDGRFISLTIEEAMEADSLICGPENIDDPKHLRVRVLAAVEEVAVLMFYTPNQDVGRTFSLKLANDEGEFKLLGLGTTTATYKDKDAAYYMNLGEQWFEEDKILSAYFAYNLAFELSYISEFLQTGQNIYISQKFASLSQDKALQFSIKTWAVLDDFYEIYHLGLFTISDSILPYIMYISPTELSEETPPPEAELLLEYLNENHSELSTIFDQVLFEAYQEAPADPNKHYPYYRVPLKFK